MSEDEEDRRKREFANSLPEWDIFFAHVKGGEIGFSLSNLALCFAHRKLEGMDPVYINPLTLRQFNKRTLRRMVARFEELVQADLLPKPLSFAWCDWDKDKPATAA